MSRIGQNIKSKQEEGNAPYIAIGIAKAAEKKFLIVELKINGMEVITRKVLKECANYSEAIHEYQIAVGTFSMKYINEKSGG